MGCQSSNAAAGDASSNAPTDVGSPRRGVRFSSKYKLAEHQPLGHGNFAVVRRAFSKESKEEFAVKCFKRAGISPDDEAAVFMEVDILRKLRHKNVVRFVDFCEDKEFYYIVMELVTGGELLAKLGGKDRYTEGEAHEIVTTLAEAMAYLHDNNVVHRDLKPENILLSDSSDHAVLKLCDFGFAKLLKNPTDCLHTRCGSPGYVAPEVIQGFPYGKPSDIWSLGVLYYVLFCGYLPFNGMNMVHQCREIVAGRFIFPHKDWSGISEGVKDLIRRMLVTDPDKRYTAKDVLRHPWVYVRPADPCSELPDTVLPSLRSYHEGSMKSLGTETDVIEVKRKKSFEMMRLASQVQADLLATPLQTGPEQHDGTMVSDLDLTAHDTADVIQVDVDVPVFSPMASETVHTTSSQSVVVQPVSDALAKPEPPVLIAEQSTITEPVGIAALTVTDAVSPPS